MSEVFTIPAKRLIVNTEEVAPALSQLTLEYGTPSIASKAHVRLRTRLESGGEWDDSVEELYAVIEDDMTSELRLATLVNNLILDAVVPADDPRAIALGMGGKTVRQMGEILVTQKLMEQAA